MASALCSASATQTVATSQRRSCISLARLSCVSARTAIFPGRRIAAPRPTFTRVSAVLTKEKVSLDVQKMEPMGDRVLVKPIEEQPQSSGGVLLPSSATKGQQDALVGEVLAIGDEVELGIKVGDAVLYQKYSTADVETATGEICFVSQRSILAVVS